MTAPRLKPADLPDWPRLMRADLAAAYVGLSLERFRGAKIPALTIGSGRMWDREVLDRWVDGLSQPEQHARKRWLDELDDGESERAGN